MTYMRRPGTLGRVVDDGRDRLASEGRRRLGLLRQPAGMPAAVLGEELLEQLLAGRVGFDVELVEQVGAKAPVGAARGVGVAEVGLESHEPPVQLLAVGVD